MLRFDAKPQPITIIQVYLPTAAEDDEVLTVYAKIQKVVDECPKKGRLIVMGELTITPR